MIFTRRNSERHTVGHGMIQRLNINAGTRRRGAAILAALACVGSAAVVAGCGGSSGGNVLDPVAQAATRSTSVAGYRMNLNMQISSSALSSAITATGSGSFSPRDKAGSFALSMNLGNEPQITQALGGSTLKIEEIFKWPVIYMKLPDAIMSKLPGGGSKPWLKIDLTKAAAAAGVPGLSSLTNNPASSDPSQFLQYLRAVSGNITNVGKEQVGGIATTHYKASIDLSKVPNTLPESSRAAARQGVAALQKMLNGTQLPVQVWIDGQHLVRRMQMSFTSNAGGQSATIGMTIEIPEYGPQSAPTLPPADQVNDTSGLLGSA
jgi:hypothetical protein